MSRIVSLTMFASLWIMLLGSIPPPARTDVLLQLTDTVAAVTRERHVDNRWLADMFRSTVVERTGGRERTQPYYDEMLRVLDTIGRVQTALSAIEAHLRAAPDIAVRMSRKHSMKLIGQLHQELQRAASVSRSQRFSEGGTYRQLRKAALLGSTSIEQTVLDPSPALLREMVFRSSFANALGIIAAIRYELAELENRLLSALYVDGGPTCILRFDAITALALPDPGYAPPGSRAQGTLLVATYSHALQRPQIRSDRGHVEMRDGVGYLTYVTARAGWQTVRGEIAISNRDGSVQHAPWQLRYFSGPAYVRAALGTTPVLDGNASNLVELAGHEGFPAGSLSLESPDAAILQQAAGRYLIRPRPRVRSVTLRLRFLHEGQTDTLEQLVIPVRNAPLPRLAIGAAPGAELSAEDLQHAAGISVYTEDGQVAAGMRVETFSARIENGVGDELGSFAVTGSEFGNSPALAAAIAGLQRGDRLFIEGASIRDSAGHLLRPANLYFRLH